MLWYFDSLDKKQKESRRFLWDIFLWGVIVTFIAGFIEYFLAPFASSLFSQHLTQAFFVAFIVTACAEEGLKYAVVKKKTYPHPAFDEYYDGVIYAVVASLGFAALENIFYVIEGGLYIAIIRALLAVPAHALFGAFMGYYISLARFEKNPKKETTITIERSFLRHLFPWTLRFLATKQFQHSAFCHTNAFTFIYQCTTQNSSSALFGQNRKCIHASAMDNWKYY